MDDSAERVAEVRARIERAAQRVGRSAEQVRLVAVSKNKPAEAIRHAFVAGCRDFGENYAQELCAKMGELNDLESIRWHFVGHLQSKKVRQVIEGVALYHAVDRAKLVAELDKRAAQHGRIAEVLLQVNLVAEASKSGCSADELPGLLAAAKDCKHLRVRGLMTMPPYEDSPERTRPHFRQLRELRDELGGRERLPELSMGMSHDFEVAIEEGATIVRVGMAIFGPR